MRTRGMKPFTETILGEYPFSSKYERMSYKELRMSVIRRIAKEAKLVNETNQPTTNPQLFSLFVVHYSLTSTQD